LSFSFALGLIVLIVMGILTDILKEAPLSAVLQEKVKTFEVENAELKQQLDDCRRLYQVLQDENKNLAALLSEDVFFHKGTEFRKGRTTANQWLAFCPVCHLPVKAVDGLERFGLVCSNAPKCGWKSPYSAFDLEKIIGEVAVLKR
jgi:hypothetical protein